MSEKDKCQYQSVWVRCDKCGLEQIKFVQPGEVFIWECVCGGMMHITERRGIYKT